MEIKVPEGMLKAAVHSAMRDGLQYDSIPIIIEAALRWLDSLLAAMEKDNDGHTAYCAAIDEVRRMFLAPEPEIPEDIKDLLGSPEMTHTNECIIEAYRRGQKAGK